MPQKVNPYEVEGKIDYDKLIAEFGVKKITPEVLKEIQNLFQELSLYI